MRLWGPDSYRDGVMGVMGLSCSEYGWVGVQVM